jgi:hypothetical protein
MIRNNVADLEPVRHRSIAKKKPRGEAGPRHQTRVETSVVYLDSLFSPISSSRLYFTARAPPCTRGSTLPEFAFPGDTLIPVVVFDFISRLPSSFGHKGDDRVPLAQSTNRFLTWIVMDNGANLIFVCHHSPSLSRGLQERATGAALCGPGGPDLATSFRGKDRSMVQMLPQRTHSNTKRSGRSPSSGALRMRPVGAPQQEHRGGLGCASGIALRPCSRCSPDNAWRRSVFR